MERKDEPPRVAAGKYLKPAVRDIRQALNLGEGDLNGDGELNLLDIEAYLESARAISFGKEHIEQTDTSSCFIGLDPARALWRPRPFSSILL